MNFYVVMQSMSYQQSKQHGVIWNTQLDSAGNMPHSWARMQQVKQGDFIFHFVKGEIIACSEALQDCTTGVFPDGASDEVGFMFQTKYEELAVPLSVKRNFEAIQRFLPLKYSPFQQNGDGNQGFLYPCNELLAEQLIVLISESNLFPETAEQLQFAIGPIVEQTRDELAPMLFKAEATAKLNVRKGKQVFYKQMTSIWSHKCALCGIELPSLLHPSYAKPWKDATNEERTNPYNGILLCKNHGELYDEGFIAFDGTGKIHISSQLPTYDYGKYSIHPKMKITREEPHKVFIKWHKRNIWRG